MRKCLLLGWLICAAPSVWAGEHQSGIIGEGTAWATVYHVQDSGRRGPTVMIVGGVHGNEPAGVLAAEQIRHWPIVRGKLVVVPRANVLALAAGRRMTPDEPFELANLNRNFPRAGSNEPPRGAQAAALWEFACRVRPTWFVDLHEGYDFNINGGKSVGSSLIVYPTTEGRAAAALMQAAVNATITNQSIHFTLLSPPVDGSFARAVGAHLGAHAMILETTTKDQPLSLRARQHRLMVHTLLRHLGMIGDEVSVHRLLDARMSGRAALRVALYDAAGAGGQGPQRIRELVTRLKNAVLMPIGPDEICNGALPQFNVLVCPGGSGSAQGNAIGKEGRERIRKFVEDGSGYIGICAGAYLATSGYSWGLKILDAKTVSPKWRRGVGMVKIELTDKGREILGDHPGLLDCKYANGPILCPAGEDTLPDYEVLAWFRTEIAKNDTPAGVMVNSPAIVAGRCGKGRVMAISPHPEQTDGLQELVTRAIRWAAGMNGTGRAGS
ncbi:MAG: succinylglutamate desuccinylase/aspartoacylase family protein [Verrucomicrobiae bacterium]|nr:succinylglutamate desuccinylase/aspartoacylase family protein [Verrucomicrobiae bacterium]